jgi:hypothetical protein
MRQVFAPQCYAMRQMNQEVATSKAAHSHAWGNTGIQSDARRECHSRVISSAGKVARCLSRQTSARSDSSHIYSPNATSALSFPLVSAHSPWWCHIRSSLAFSSFSKRLRRPCPRRRKVMAHVSDRTK